LAKDGVKNTDVDAGGVSVVDDVLVDVVVDDGVVVEDNAVVVVVVLDFLTKDAWFMEANPSVVVGAESAKIA